MCFRGLRVQVDAALKNLRHIPLAFLQGPYAQDLRDVLSSDVLFGAYVARTVQRLQDPPKLDTSAGDRRYASYEGDAKGRLHKFAETDLAGFRQLGELLTQAFLDAVAGPAEPPLGLSASAETAEQVT